MTERSFGTCRACQTPMLIYQPGQTLHPCCDDDDQAVRDWLDQLRADWKKAGAEPSQGVAEQLADIEAKALIGQAWLNRRHPPVDPGLRDALVELGVVAALP